MRTHTLHGPRRWRVALGFCAVGLIVAVVATVSASVGEPHRGSGPSRLSLLAVRLCARQRTVGGRGTCFQSILDPLVNTYGVRALLTSLEAHQRADGWFRVHCHEMAHTVGRSWIAHGRTLSDGFREGVPICSSGFYHGMVERALRGPAADGSELDHVGADDLRAKAASVCTPAVLGSHGPLLRHQCLHGLGHALVFSVGYRLPLALAICDRVGDQESRQTCYRGAFMENIVGVERDRRMVRRGDAHYPCTAVGEPYRPVCYVMQTTWMTEEHRTWGEMVAACREAGPYRLSCFRGLGRYVGAWIERDGPARHVADCTQFAGDEARACLSEAAYELAGAAIDGRYVFPYCAALTGPLMRRACFHEAHTRLITVYERTPGDEETSCRGYLPSVEECVGSIPVLRSSTLSAHPVPS